MTMKSEPSLPYPSVTLSLHGAGSGVAQGVAEWGGRENKRPAGPIPGADLVAVAAPINSY